MYHYDPAIALEELRDDAVLPHPVHLRDMILRTKLDPTKAMDLNREFSGLLDAIWRAAEAGGDGTDRSRSGACGRRRRLLNWITLAGFVSGCLDVPFENSAHQN